MASLNEILRNEKMVVFSYGEDTINIRYKLFAFKRRSIYNRIQKVTKLADKWKSEFLRKLAQRMFLKRVLIAWDLTDGETKLSIDKGLRTLPPVFVGQLYWLMMSELLETSHAVINETIKKK